MFLVVCLILAVRRLGCFFFLLADSPLCVFTFFRCRDRCRVLSFGSVEVILGLVGRSVGGTWVLLPLYLVYVPGNVVKCTAELLLH